MRCLKDWRHIWGLLGSSRCIYYLQFPILPRSFHFLMLDLAGYCKYEGKQCRGSGWESTEPTIISWFTGVIWSVIFSPTPIHFVRGASPFPHLLSSQNQSDFDIYYALWLQVVHFFFSTTLPILRGSLCCLSAGTYCQSCFLQAWWKGFSRLLCHSHMRAQEGTV